MVKAASIAIGGAATTFALVFMVVIGVQQDSLFAFIGALIGATATVGGAAWLTDYNRRVERDAEAALLTKEFRKLLDAAEAAQTSEPGQGMPWPDEYRPLLYTLAEKAGDVHAVAGEALTHGKALTFIHRAAVRRVGFAIDQYLQFWTDANAEGELHPMDERNFPDLTADVVKECKAAIGELAATRHARLGA